MYSRFRCLQNIVELKPCFCIHVKMKFHNLVYFVRLPPQVFNERAAESSKLYSLALLYWLCIPGGSCLHSLPPPLHSSTVTPVAQYSAYTTLGLSSSLLLLRLENLCFIHGTQGGWKSELLWWGRHLQNILVEKITQPDIVLILKLAGFWEAFFWRNEVCSIIFFLMKI